MDSRRISREILLHCARKKINEKKIKLISKKLPDRNFDLHLEEVGEGRGSKKGRGVPHGCCGVCIGKE